MEARDISIIIIVTIWLLASLVTGILALISREKFRSYKVKSFEFKEKFEQEKKDFTLKEVKIQFELPKDEKCYLFLKNQPLIKVKQKSRKSNTDFKKDVKFEKLIFNLYLTNKRVMIQLNDKYFDYKINSVNYCHYLILYYKKNWVLATEIEINEDKYVILTENFDLIYGFQSITKKGE